MNKDLIQGKITKCYWDYDNNATIVADMGVGKTAAGIKIANKIKNPINILVISPKKSISGKIKGGNSWEKELLKFTSHHNWETTTIQTAVKWDKKDFDKYSFVIFDEIHEILTKNRIIVFDYLTELGVRYLGLTGTPDDNNEFKLDCYNKYCPIIYKYLEAAEDNIINKTKVVVYDHILTNDIAVELKIKGKTKVIGESDAYNYFENKLNSSRETIEDYYFKEVKQRLNLELKSDIKEEYKYILNDLNTNTLEEFRDVYWKYIKGKQLPFVVYRLFRKIQGEDYAKFGMKSNYYAARAPREIQSYFYTYSWARDNRRTLLLRLNSTAEIAKTIGKEIVNKGNKVLIFSEENAQVDKITKNTYYSKNSAKLNTETLEAFNSGKIYALGTSKALSLGINLKNVKYAILESFQGSETRNAQNKGRLHRLGIDDEGVFIIIRVLNTQNELWFDKIKDTFNTDNIVYYNNLKQLIDNEIS